MEKKTYEMIMAVYKDIQNGKVVVDEVQVAYDLIPDPRPAVNTLTKMRAINQYIIFHDMPTEIIDNQSDQGDVAPPTALKAGVKTKAKTRRKTKAKAKSKRGWRSK